MSTPRIVRVNELLKREIAEDLYRHFMQSDFDCTALTVTRVECTTDLRDANVFVSVFGHKEEGEREAMIGFLNRHRQEIVRMMVKRVKLKYTPRLHFKLDESIERGDNILALLNELERENPAAFKEDNGADTDGGV
jgi:ribosome-binding factor A